MQIEQNKKKERKAWNYWITWHRERMFPYRCPFLISWTKLSMPICPVLKLGSYWRMEMAFSA